MSGRAENEKISQQHTPGPIRWHLADQEEDEYLNNGALEGSGDDYE